MSSSGSGGSDSPYIGSDGISWVRIATSFIGAWFLAVVFGLAEFVQMVIAAAARAPVGVLEFLDELVGDAFAIPTTLLNLSWLETEGFVEMFGPAALPVAMILTMAALILLSVLIDVLGGSNT